MLPENAAKLDELAAPNHYVLPANEEDLAYVTHFHQVCQRYHIVFSEADEDEREFVVRMAEKSFYPKRA